MYLRIQLKKKVHPNAPLNLSGVLNSDGSITVNWDNAEGARAYLTHYGDANQGAPSELKYMGYSEMNSWTLAAENVPSLQDGDFILITVQTYNVKAPESIKTEVEKAAYLHDGQFTGSPWSKAVQITK
ncbi:fibronectin type III domain-containing protein [Lactococcus petauri]|uniref:fibronectin type III domain-containing protein n=1 Tax=Lactococcus petauri TaxID=1940789 RepID=UPI0038544942